MPGPSSATTSSAAPSGSGARADASRACRAACGAARSRSGWSRRAGGRRGCRRGRRAARRARASWSRARRLELAGRLDDHVREIERLARRCTAASVRASSSRSPTSRRIRCVERSAERGGLAVGPRSDSTSSSRFASTLVSGVRSSCEASATKARWRSSVVSVSSRAAASEASMPLSVRESSATSSSAVGCGQRPVGVAGALDLGCRGGQLGDRRDRAARDERPGAQASTSRRARRAAGSSSSARSSPRSELSGARTGRYADRRLPVLRDVDDRRVDHSVAVDHLTAARAAGRRGAGRRWQPGQTASPSSERIAPAARRPRCASTAAADDRHGPDAGRR